MLSGKVVVNSAAVRSQVAAALGSLVRCDPGCALPLSQNIIKSLLLSIEQLQSLSAPYGASHPIPWNLMTKQDHKIGSYLN